MTAQALYQEAARRGLRLEQRGDKLAVIPAHRVAPDFADVLRQHKRDLLNWLEVRSRNLPLGQARWLPVARQILTGEFDGADRSTRESLIIGLRSIPHRHCRLAIERLGVQSQRETPE